MFPQATVHELPPNLRWRTVSPKKEESVKGVLAGAPVAIISHFVAKRTVPCLEWISAGKLPCPCEEIAAAARRTAYVPVVTASGEKLVVICSDSTLRALEGLSPGGTLEIGRGKCLRRACYVKTLAPDTLPEGFAKKIRELPNHDIRPYLLHLWQIPELYAYFKIERFDPIRLKKAKAKAALYFPATTDTLPA
jgi:hypothetical protein